MEYRIESVGKQRFAARVRSFDNETKKDEKGNDIPHFWRECQQDKSVETIRDLHPEGRKDLYGLCMPTKKNDRTFDYGIGVILDQDAAPISEEVLRQEGYQLWENAPSDYVVFSCYGEDGSCINEMWSRFFKEFLPQSMYEQSEETDYEVYFEKGEPGLFCELWIPIKKK